MNDMRKLMEAVEQIGEAPVLVGIENDEVEEHLDAAAKALAKDAVLQASGVWDEEGRDEGGYDTGAKTGKEYVSIAAPRFLDNEYKGSIMAAFQNSFDNYVQHFLEYVNESAEVDEARQGGKTEHSGAKKGKGAYYGRKKEAKRDSNKNRRKAGKSQSREITEVTTEDGTTYSLGTVQVTVFDDEITLKHGFNQQLFLSREEWSDFIRGVAHNRLGESEELGEDNFYGGGHLKTAGPREATVSLHELMDEGVLDARTVADAALNYMSEAEVEDMASDNSFFGDE